MNGSWTLPVSRMGKGVLSGTEPDSPCARSLSPKDMVAKYTRVGGPRGEEWPASVVRRAMGGEPATVGFVG